LDDEELDGYGSEVKTPSKKGAFNKTVSGRIVKTPMSTPRKTGGRAPARTNREVNYTDSFGDNDSDQDVFNATPIKMEAMAMAMEMDMDMKMESNSRTTTIPIIPLNSCMTVMRMMRSECVVFVSGALIYPVDQSIIDCFTRIFPSHQN